jgi:glutamate-1-semialdehyde 2,1-aminomutase
MLLSKRPEMFLPDNWPAYYSKASGITVTDLDQKTYLDFATMSVGACSLGYGNEVVDRAVLEAVRSGVMSTLNSPGEVRLAEKLVELHPWASMVRFARTGGEANAIAIRIARAHTGKDKVAICGYHGWHDWYLSANLGENSSLDGHLLPGLDPAGVPRQLRGTTVPFGYNDIESLETLLRTGDFGAVQMEVSRNFGPAEGFLQKVRDLCDHFGVVLIFDECTSGFRETFGGLHKKYGVDPDIAMFGKALGNGYAITAVVGRLAVMESAQSTFISSTFWTERLGPEAALATLFEMERVRSWEILPEKGKMIKEIWKQELDALGLDFQISGIDALPTFALKAENWLTLKTLFIQEMLDKGFLSTGGFYSSTAHDTASIDLYRAAFAESMSLVASNLDESSARSHLRGPIAHAGFARLN